MPSKVDEIRAYALEHYVRRWRRSDEKRLAIRAGDVVRGMHLHNATPNVCSALTSRKFQLEAGIVLVHREGPRQSTTTTFHYEPDRVTPNSPAQCDENSTPRPRYPRATVDRPITDRDGAWRTADLCLVSCVSAKQPGAAPARELYVSPWFHKARICVGASGCPWYILSAKYGIVDPHTTIAPYNLTLKSMPVNQRRSWASGVVEDLALRLAGVNSVAFLAGKTYREFLEPVLCERGIAIYVPMEGMGIGRQLSWLADQTLS